MKTLSQAPWLRTAVVLFPLALVGAAACIDADLGDAGTCSDGTRNYAFGQRFAAPDGCNTCVCGANGSANCTTLACGVSDSGCIGAGCEGGGGDSGSGSCTGPYCAYSDGGSPPPLDAYVPPIEDASLATCEYSGAYVQEGVHFGLFGCDVCRCDSTGVISCEGCTDAGVPAEDSAVPAEDATVGDWDAGGSGAPGTPCSYAGATYADGEHVEVLFPGEEACPFDCVCSRGSLGCTRYVCNPGATDAGRVDASL